MASSLLDSLTALAGPTVVNTAAARLGESPEAVTHGLTAGFSAILAGLVGKVTQNGGGGGGSLQQIFDLVQNNMSATRAADHPAELADALPPTPSPTADAVPTGAASAMPASLMGAGQQLLSSVFAGHTSSVTNVIAQASGLRPTSAASLMNMAAPLVLGMLGKRISEGGLNSAGFANLLSGEQDSILRAAPAGVASLAGFGDMTRSIADRFTGAPPLSTAADATRTATRNATHNATRDAAMVEAATNAKGRRWLWPLIIVLILVALVWNWSRGRARNAAASQTVPGLVDTARTPDSMRLADSTGMTSQTPPMNDSAMAP